MNTNQTVKLVLGVVVLAVISFLGYYYYTLPVRKEQNRQFVVQRPTWANDNDVYDDSETDDTSDES